MTLQVMTPTPLITVAPVGWFWSRDTTDERSAIDRMQALWQMEVTNTRGGPVVIPS